MFPSNSHPSPASEIPPVNTPTAMSRASNTRLARSVSRIFLGTQASLIRLALFSSCSFRPRLRGRSDFGGSGKHRALLNSKVPTSFCKCASSCIYLHIANSSSIPGALAHINILVMAPLTQSGPLPRVSIMAAVVDTAALLPPCWRSSTKTASLRSWIHTLRCEISCRLIVFLIHVPFP